MKRLPFISLLAASGVVLATSSAVGAVNVQRYTYLFGLGPQNVGKFCGACYGAAQGEKPVGGGWYADYDSLSILASQPGRTVDPYGVPVETWCLTAKNLTQREQPFVGFVNCASGLAPGSTVSEVWSDYSSIPAKSYSQGQVDCPTGSVATSTTFYTHNAARFTISKLTLSATGTSALVDVYNLASTDMQAQSGAVCLSVPGASMAVSGSYDAWDPGDGETRRVGVSCPAGTVNTGGGWRYRNDISGYLPICQNSDNSFPNGWTIWVSSLGNLLWPDVQAFCLTAP